MDILVYGLFLILGVLITYIFFKNKMYNKLEGKYKSLIGDKSLIDDIEEYKRLKVEYKKSTDDIKKLENKIDTLKLYIGLVDDHEYGIIHRDLNYSDDDVGYRLIVEAEFKVVQRGSDKVKISVNLDSIKTSPNKSDNLNLMDEIKKFIDGWYDIDDKNISWILPDKSIKRDFDIDCLLRS